MEFIRRDILVLFACSFVNTGSFYDSFEYFYFLHEKGYDCGLLLLFDNTKEEILTILKDKYILNNWEEISKNIFVEPYTRKKLKIINYYSDITIAPSMCMLAVLLLTKSYIFPFTKIYMMYEAPLSIPYINKAFGDGRFGDKIVLLGDSRCMIPFPKYKFIDYRKKINFKLFKPIKEEVKKSCCVNMTTPHKTWLLEDLKKVLDHYGLDNYFIYCMKKSTNISKFYYYKQLESENIKVVESPVENFMLQFDKLLHLLSNRLDDPSPRLLAECIFYNKEVIYHEFGKIKDGAYYRWLDCKNDFESLILKDDDDILDIINLKN